MDKATEQQNNKRIAKNTLLLYFRMLLTMGVGLYTSRVILQTLGVEDFGIYNVVGGVVSMFAVISGSLSAAISRFITFELGKNDYETLRKVFSSAVTIQIILAILILILAESVGLWFLNAKMSIPIERMGAANWVLHFSIITFCINLISVPYNAAIIAHERMRAFAYVSIIEAFGKLAIAWAILASPIDKLVFYAFLMCSIAVIIRIIYGWYCKKHFDECTYHFFFDKPLIKEMFGFAGWNFIGASSAVLRDHGGNIVLNLFFGPTVNAARGIATQVQNAVYQFMSSFTTALNPQITKSYASGNHAYMMSLIFKGARLSFYMLMLISLPILLNTEFILGIWLKNFPEHTVRFVQLTLIFVLSESISAPLITAMLATGNIRNYQIVVGGLQMMNLPVSYILLKFGFAPEFVFVTAICISQCCLWSRLFMLKNMISLKIRSYLKHVYLNVISVFIVSLIIPISATLYFSLATKPLDFFILCILSISCSSITCLYIGCNCEERNFVYSKIASLKNRFTRS